MKRAARGKNGRLLSSGRTRLPFLFRPKQKSICYFERYILIMRTGRHFVNVLSKIFRNFVSLIFSRQQRLSCFFRKKKILLFNISYFSNIFTIL